MLIMKDTDESIYARYLKNGKDEDLRELLERHRESLVLFLYGILRNMEDAEEIMLDAFAVAASGTSRFDGRSSFRTWLYAIARKKAVSLLRKRRFSFFGLEEVREHPSDRDHSPELSILREERDRALYLALDQLRNDYRQVLYLLYLEGMDHEEAARIMGKSPRQIYNLVYQGKKALKEKLEGMGIDDAQFR